MTIPSLTDDDRALLERYRADVLTMVEPVFLAAGTRLIGGARLSRRFQEAMDAVQSHGRVQFRGVDETHNELCIALALLDQAAAMKVEYEPRLSGTAQTVDFVVTAAQEYCAYLDVKTIRPERKDNWTKFEEVQKKGRLTPNVEIVLSRAALGGELWHGMYAARGRMLEYSLEFEAKLRAANVGAGAPATMMFAGEGFAWERDQLEDFVGFYRTGHHRADDPFAVMEQRYIEERRITLDRSIGAFGSMRRGQFELQPSRLSWDVRPPIFE